MLLFTIRVFRRSELPARIAAGRNRKYQKKQGAGSEGEKAGPDHGPLEAAKHPKVLTGQLAVIIHDIPIWRIRDSGFDGVHAERLRRCGTAVGKGDRKGGGKAVRGADFPRPRQPDHRRLGLAESLPARLLYLCAGHGSESETGSSGPPPCITCFLRTRCSSCSTRFSATPSR